MERDGMSLVPQGTAEPRSPPRPHRMPPAPARAGRAAGPKAQPQEPAGCPALTFQPRAYAWRSSADRFICLYLFFCCRGECGGGGVSEGLSPGDPTPVPNLAFAFQAGSWGCRPLPPATSPLLGMKMGRVQCSQDPCLPPPHRMAPEPGGDDDLALAHQLVLGPAPPTPKHLLDEGGELTYALLAPLLQVEELQRVRASCRESLGAATLLRSPLNALGAHSRVRGLWGRSPPCIRPCPALGSGLTVRGERMKILV